jgi:RNA recognition motif-containing protein
LTELFAAYGSVESARVISDRFTGQSKGFGFIEMGTSQEAQKAIESLNGTQFQGRTIIVNEARPQEKRAAGGGAAGNRDRYRR